MTDFRSVSPSSEATAFSRRTPGCITSLFAAPTRVAVDDLYQTLIAMEATILDPHAIIQYEPKYYAVFFLDPDGIKLEYVFTPDENPPRVAL